MNIIMNNEKFYSPNTVQMKTCVIVMLDLALLQYIFLYSHKYK